jgi:hypothetical protein
MFFVFYCIFIFLYFFYRNIFCQNKEDIFINKIQNSRLGSEENRCSKRKLTHIVMPFHPKQYNIVKSNLHSWIKNKPCTTSILHPNVTLIFFLSSRKNKTLENIILSLIYKNQIEKCFNRVFFSYANLTKSEDKYYKGSRIMFEMFISKIIFQNNQAASFAFYMEPDSTPIRNNWLIALENEIIVPNSYFWMKGSIFRGNPSAIKTNYLFHRVHINGNAIYNLCDLNFTKFYFDLVINFIKKIELNQKEISYDTSFFKFLFWKNGTYTQEFFTKFVFSNFIQNYYHSSMDLRRVLRESPDTFFIHGKVNSIISL